jgi:hypothetical protein
MVFTNNGHSKYAIRHWSALFRGSWPAERLFIHIAIRGRGPHTKHPLSRSTHRSLPAFTPKQLRTSTIRQVGVSPSALEPCYEDHHGFQVEYLPLASLNNYIMSRQIVVASCSPAQWALDWEGNSTRIKKSIQEAKAQGATLRVGAELEVSRVVLFRFAPHPLAPTVSSMPGDTLRVRYPADQMRSTDMAVMTTSTERNCIQIAGK